MRCSYRGYTTAIGAVGVALGVALGAAWSSSAADGRHELSLADAVRIAIANDPELYIAREDVQVAAEGVALARSAFARRLFGEVHAMRDAQAPTASSFRAVDTTYGGSIGIAGRAETGLNYTVSAGLARQDLDDPFSTVYDGATTTTVGAELVQPLRRGAFSAARRPIVVASLRQSLSEHELRASIERTVAGVQIAYWDLVRARSERAARASAVALAKEQVEDSRRLLRLGTGSDLDVVEAEAGVSRRQQELLRTELDVVDADGRLFAALGVRAGEAGLAAGRQIVPTDQAELAPRAPDVDALLALARANRADARAAQAQIAVEAAELEVTGDRRRAAIDLVAAAGTTGFAGSLASSYSTAGVNGGGLEPAYRTDPAYDGGALTSIANTLGRDLRLYVGLRFELPLGRHDAEVRHAIQRRTVERARLVERATLVRIEGEVRTASAQVAVNGQLVEAADRTVVLAEQVLEGTRKRFRAGAGTSFDVLRVSEDLTRAQIEAARSRAGYRASLTRLAAATGTLLDGLGISVESLGASPK